MKCERCGTEFNDQERTCPNCGLSVTVKEPETPEQDGGGKKKKTILLAMIAVAVIAVCAAAAVISSRKDPKETVIAAFSQWMNAGEESPSEKIFGFRQFANELGTKNSETSMTLRMDGSTGIDTSAINGAALRLETKSDLENQKLGMDLTAVYGGMDFLGMNLYFGGRELMFASPELIDPVLYLDLGEGLADRLAASPTIGPMLAEQGQDAEEVAAQVDQFFDQAEQVSQNPLDFAALIERYQAGCKAQESFKAALTVERGEKGTFTLDGQEVSCDGYQVHVSKDSMIEFLRTSADFFLNDEEFRSQYLEQLRLSALLMEETLDSSLGEVLTAEELLEEDYGDVRAEVDELIALFDSQLTDVDMTVYVDSKGRLAQFEGTTTILPEPESGEANSDLSFRVTAEGGSYLMENWNGELLISQAGESVAITFQKTGSYDGSLAASESVLKVEEAGTAALQIVWSGSYDSSSGDFDLNFSLESPEDAPVSIAGKGIVTELEKGTSITCVFDELTLNAGEESVTVSGDFAYGPLTSEVTAPAGETMDVLAATEDDWNNLLVSLYFKFISLIVGTADLS